MTDRWINESITGFPPSDKTIKDRTLVRWHICAVLRKRKNKKKKFYYVLSIRACVLWNRPLLLLKSGYLSIRVRKAVFVTESRLDWGSAGTCCLQLLCFKETRSFYYTWLYQPAARIPLFNLLQQLFALDPEFVTSRKHQTHIRCWNFTFLQRGISFIWRDF